MNLRPSVFMSHMAEELYTTWEEVMGCPKVQRFLIWHVVEKWKKNQREKVKDKDLRDTVYKKLKPILKELDENKFTILLEGVLKYFDSYDKLKLFFKYFIQNCFKSQIMALLFPNLQ